MRGWSREDAALWLPGKRCHRPSHPPLLLQALGSRAFKEGVKSACFTAADH